MKDGNLDVFGKIFITLIIGGILVYTIFAMSGYGTMNAEKECERITGIIDKALVQCYALEGSYPADIQYLQNYGVILDPYKYIYGYSWIASNIKPGLNVQINQIGRPEFDVENIE